MRIIALVEYEIVGNSEYRYVEEWDVRYDNWTYMVWKKRFIRHLLQRGIVCTYIKAIRVEYEK